MSASDYTPSSEIGLGFGLTQWTHFIVHAQKMTLDHDRK